MGTSEKNPTRAEAASDSERASWSALSAEELTQVGVRLCHCRTRVTKLGGRQEARPGHGKAAMCGRLIDCLVDEYKNCRLDKTGPKPTNAGLIRQAKKRNPGLILSERDVSDFRNGHPKYEDRSEADQSHFWFEMTWDWAKDILLGTEAAPAKAVTTEQENLADEIRGFFLGSKRGEPPKFFDRARRTCAGPFTEEEMRGGIVWIVREQQITRAKGMVAFVSGDAEFLQKESYREGGVDYYGQRTLEIAQHGLDVYFVYPDPVIVLPTAASRSLESFFRVVTTTSQPCETWDHVFHVPLNPGQLSARPAKAPMFWSGEYLNKTILFAYLERDSPRIPDEDKKSLYVRRTIMEADETQWRPFAERACPKMAQLFGQWLHTFLPPKPESLSSWYRRHQARSS